MKMYDGVGDSLTLDRAGEIAIRAKELFDNRLGEGNGRLPFAPRDFWARLGEALYGPDDARVQSLRQCQKCGHVSAPTGYVEFVESMMGERSSA